MWPVSSSYGEAARNGGVQYAVCDVWRAGIQVATDLSIVSGSVTDDSSGGIRRKLEIELAPELGLWDLLVPNGTELRVRSVVRYPSGATESVPMGLFDISGQSMSYGKDGSIHVRGDDKWARIQRARFIRPEPSNSGAPIVQQIAELIRSALGQAEPVHITATSTESVGTVVWERDRDKAIEELAKSIGAYVSFDREGNATIEDLPTAGVNPVWTVDASETGVMLSGDRDRDRTRTYNVVVAASDRSDGDAPFDPIIIWDNDPASPTYAGTDPTSVLNEPGTFGVAPYFYTSSLLENVPMAERAAYSLLSRATGLASQLSLTAIRNHALDSLDAITALLPAERYDQEQPSERHIIDKVTHPLLPTGTQQIETRSTREDEIS